jgi:acylglycerol lipase
MHGIRTLFAAALLSLTTACAPNLPAVSDTGAASLHSNDALIMPDGFRLPVQITRPEGPVRAVFVALHGFNDYSNAWRVQSERWAESGISTYAVDQRGFGRTETRGEWSSALQMALDARAAVRMAASTHPGTPVFLVGESMGAAISIVATSKLWEGAAPLPLAGMILSAPAVRARRTMNWFYRASLWVGTNLLPGVTVHPPRGLGIQASDNIPMLRALGADPLVIKGAKISALSGVVDLMDMALDHAADLRGPVLILYGTNDQVIPKEPTCLMISRLPVDAAREREIVLYPNGWHMLTRDLEGQRVVDDISAWALGARQGLPSGLSDKDASAFKLFCEK